MRTGIEERETQPADLRTRPLPIDVHRCRGLRHGCGGAWRCLRWPARPDLWVGNPPVEQQGTTQSLEDNTMTERPTLSEPSPQPPPRRRSWLRRWRYPLIGGAALLAVSGIVAVAPSAQASVPFAVESLDGSGNNVQHPTWGAANQPVARQGTAHYADGIGQPFTGPDARFVSNRLFSDTQQNVFSERRVSQWGWTWGQFIDHNIGHRLEVGAGADPFNIGFSNTDPLEEFSNTTNVIAFNRSPNFPGTGTSTANPRQQINTIPSYISGNPIYGTTNARLDWLRQGPLDGDPTNNSALLMLPGGYLPTRDARGDPANAPAMDSQGHLAATPNDTAVAGDARANENIALTATHTLFAREHNRIVGLLPTSLSDEDRFQIARRVVIAEIQYITYQEFLPAMGVSLPQYEGYNPNVDATETNEFATAAFRAHTQIHGDGLEIDNQPASRYSAATLASLAAQGAVITNNGDGTVSIDVNLNLMFFNPDLLKQLQIGPVLQSIGGESQYNNDIEIDNQLRSALFELPINSTATCLTPTDPDPACFNVVTDLGAFDVQRGRDHGIGTYNQVRAAYGLAPVTSFTQITGESTDALPAGDTINSPNILTVTKLTDIDGKTIDLNNTDAVNSTAVRDVRATTVAARLKAIYGSVDNIDPFVGIFAEKKVPGAEMGETQLAIWQKQFQAMRDGDRFYFGNDQGLSFIRNTFGIDFRHTLAQIIEMNTDVTAANLNATGNVFLTRDSKFPATACQVTYTIEPVSNNLFEANLAITNTSSTAVDGWTTNFELSQGQRVVDSDGIFIRQSGSNGMNITGTSSLFTGDIAPNQTVHASFTATFDGLVNQKPPNFSLNGHRCGVT
jgi:hypothetical protein